jgi:hypothetical protein
MNEHSDILRPLRRVISLFITIFFDLQRAKSYPDGKKIEIILIFCS